MTEKKVWFITGTSSGIGRALAEEALAQGYRVVATARNPDVLADLVEEYSNTAIAVMLDVVNTVDVTFAIERAISTFGRIDVLVNNAGYGLIGAIEEPSDEQIRLQFETNVFGVLRVLRRALPILRRQKSGHIINVSSSLGFFAYPSYGFYSATKFAIQGLSEALAQETDQLGIKVTIAEPGATHTDFVRKGIVEPANVLPAQYPSTSALTDHLFGTDGKQIGDPKKIAKVLIEVAESEHPPLHLPLGEDSYNGIERHLSRTANEISLERERSLATGFHSSAWQ